jgi:TPP-dependent pyruvate/acetoin dehydrogenase alpha subunit
MNDFNLNAWSVKENFTGSIKVNENSSILAKNFLKKMIYIRAVEQKVADLRRDGLIGGPVHLCIGQEAVPTGISSSLHKTDSIYGAHRSHGHLLALDTDLRKFFAELLGKSTGLSKGMGGSMHLIDKSVGFQGSVPIVAGTVSLAVGNGLAFKIKKSKNISLAYLGDGAVEEGVVHEALNFAKVHEIPILFVVENNFFSSHLHISLRQSCSSVSRFANAHEIKSAVVDGNNVMDMSQTAEQMISNIRETSEPAFIEAITYRLIGHVDWRVDIDVGVERSEKDLKLWKQRDPIKRLKEGLINFGTITEKDYQVMLSETDVVIQKALNQASEDSEPISDTTLDVVFSKGQ